MGGQPAVANAVGSTAFDAADRLAIINLLGAYAYTYDQDRLDDFRALFIEAPELVLLHEGRVLSTDIDTVMSLQGAEGKVQYRKQPTSPRPELFLFHQSNRHGGNGILLRAGIRHPRRSGPRNRI